MNEEMECPTLCVCGRMVELHDMLQVKNTLPTGGNLVCEDCFCDDCDGTGEVYCEVCYGSGVCRHCGSDCPCEGDLTCKTCEGKGYVVRGEK